MALNEKWLAGAKTFLNSSTAAFYFTSLTFEEERLSVERIVKFVQNLEDAKVKKTYVQGIIEESLTKRPYNKHLVITLIDGHLTGVSDEELARIARECLKTLTSEDLMHLADKDGQNMVEYERRYQGLQSSNFDIEVAKILARYGNEGRNESMAPQAIESRKQVRFNEDDQ
jgi:hypothetical protein